MESESFNVLIIFVSIVYFFMFLALYYSLSRVPNLFFYQKFLKAIMEIMNVDGITNDVKMNRIEMIYSQLTKKMSQKYQNNISVTIQYLITRSETLSSKDFVAKYKIELSSIQKEYLYFVLTYFDEKKPFNVLSIDHAKHLGDLKSAIESGVKSITDSSFYNVQCDIQMAESQLNEQKNVNIVSITVSILGIIFSIIFGFMSLPH